MLFTTILTYLVNKKLSLFLLIKINLKELLFIQNNLRYVYLILNRRVLFLCCFFIYSTIIVAQKKSVIDYNIEINNAKTDTLKARLQGELAWQVKFTDAKLATKLAEAEIKVGYKYKDFLKLADGFRMLGLQYVIAKKYIEGEAFYDSCIHYAILGNSDYYQASCYSLWSGLYGAHSDFDKSIALLQKGLAFAKKSNDPKIIATLSNNLAENLKLSGKKTFEIESLYLIALNNFTVTKQYTLAAVVAANLAQEYIDNNEVEKSKKTLQKSLAFLQKDTTEHFLVAQTYNAYASIYLQLQNISEAKKNALISKEILEKYALPDNLLLTIETLTKISLAEKNYTEAEQYALQQLKLAKQQQSKLNISNAYKALAQIEEYKQDYPKSISYYKLHQSWSDSVFNEKQQQNIASSEIKALLAQKEFETKFGTAQKEKLNAELNAKNNALQWQKWLAIIASALLLTIGAVLFFTNKKTKKINNNLVNEKIIVQQQANEKLILINEIHHRVKNNLTMLKSLLYLQSKAAIEPETKRILTEAQARIQSMALVHQSLYDGKNAAKLNLTLFIEELFNQLSLTYLDKSKSVTIEVQGICNEVDIETAIPLALILNELATNSFKYAFANINEGEVKTLISQKENIITIQYTDNGPGLPTKFDITNGGFGFKVMNILAEQLNATINYKKEKDNSIFIIELPV